MLFIFCPLTFPSLVEVYSWKYEQFFDEVEGSAVVFSPL